MGIFNASVNEISDGHTHDLLGMPEWVGYTFGTFFIVIGLLVLTLYKKTKANAENYRKRQLVEYNKQNKRVVNDYKKTGMFLPPWEKAKLFAPVLFGIALIILGIAWIAGQTLFSM